MVQAKQVKSEKERIKNKRTQQALKLHREIFCSCGWNKQQKRKRRRRRSLEIAFSVVGRRLQFSSSKEEGTQLVWTYILLLRWYIYNGIGHNFCKLKTPSPVKFWHKIYNITKKKPDNIKGHNKLSTIARYWYCKKQCDQRGWMTWAFPIEVQCRGIPAQIWLKVSEAEKIRQKFRFWDIKCLFQDLTWDVPKS